MGNTRSCLFLQDFYLDGFKFVNYYTGFTFENVCIHVKLLDYILVRQRNMKEPQPLDL
jgi:hypothetical protein